MFVVRHLQLHHDKVWLAIATAVAVSNTEEDAGGRRLFLDEVPTLALTHARARFKKGLLSSRLCLP